ncbi:MAG: Hpt domain-containing protein [Thauera sp.]
MSADQDCTAPRHFSPDRLLEDMFDNAAALEAVLHSVPAWMTDMRTRLHAAAAAGDTPELSRHAHTLRGVLAQLHADHAVALTRELEAVCRDASASPPTPAHPNLIALLDALHALQVEIAAWISHRPA